MKLSVQVVTVVETLTAISIARVIGISSSSSIGFEVFGCAGLHSLLF
jgi:hypothetical protein